PSGMGVADLRSVCPGARRTMLVESWTTTFTSGPESGLTTRVFPVIDFTVPTLRTAALAGGASCACAGKPSVPIPVTQKTAMAAQAENLFLPVMVACLPSSVTTPQQAVAQPMGSRLS